MANKKIPTKNSNKETIYVDVDDEITNIIDKVKNAEHKIIALVLPKRAAVLQSVVNMKLLKKAAQYSKKNIVLITSESGLLPLAGAAGIHVARSLQSKPEIPPMPSTGEDDEESMSDEGAQIDKKASVGSLAAAAAMDNDDTETIEFDNIKTDVESSDVKSKKSKINKKLKVPNFEKFRLGFVLAGLGAVLLIVGWIFAAMVLPKAKITIKTDTTTVVSSFDFTASKDQPDADINDKKLPAVFKEVKKTDSEKAVATGEKNKGEKASGTVRLKAKACAPNLGEPDAVPTGAVLTSGGNNYILQENLNFNFAGFADGSCANYETGNGEILAAEQGDGYNTDNGATFTVANRSGVTGTGSASGGTDNIVKVITQKDIDDAVARITKRQGEGAEDELKEMIESEEGMFALTETFVSGEDKISAKPEVDKEASETTVTWEANYSMLGVKRADLAELIKKDVEGEIDLEKQAITDDGIDAAIFSINNSSKGSAFLNFRTSVTAGPEFDFVAIKEEVRGKKRGEVEKYVGSLPGVNEAIVDYSPFWVYSTPKAAKKIDIIVLDSEDQRTTSTVEDE